MGRDRSFSFPWLIEPRNPDQSTPTQPQPPQAPLASPTTDDEAGDADGQALVEGEGGALDRQGSTGSGAGSGGCPQLVSFYDAYVNPTEGTVSIVQEYMDGGSLQVRSGFTAVC